MTDTNRNQGSPNKEQLRSQDNIGTGNTEQVQLDRNMTDQQWNQLSPDQRNEFNKQYPGVRDSQSGTSSR